MARVEKFVVHDSDPPRTWPQRLREALRSFWVGPISASSAGIAALFGAAPTASGMMVTDATALAISAVWCAATTIAADLSSLPLFLYRVLPNGGKEKYTGHPLFRLLHDAANPEMTSMTWRETMLLSALLAGNGYSEVGRDASGRPTGLYPIQPHRVTLIRASPTAPLQYKIANIGQPDTILDAADCIHIKGPSPDGLAGYHLVSLARETLGLAMSAERFAARFFSNGSTVGGILTVPHSLPELARENLRQTLAQRHAGADAAHKLLLLEGGMTYTATATSPRDSQFNELRTFQLREIARFFKIPVSLLGDLERSTFSNHEQQVLSYYTSCLRGWCVRLEQELMLKLIAPSERNLQVIEHSVAGLLRGDVEKRGQFYQVLVSNGIATVNEIREFENLPPIAGGDVARVPLNSGPISTASARPRSLDEIRTDERGE